MIIRFFAKIVFAIAFSSQKTKKKFTSFRGHFKGVISKMTKKSICERDFGAKKIKK